MIVLERSNSTTSNLSSSGVSVVSTGVTTSATTTTTSSSSSKSPPGNSTSSGKRYLRRRASVNSIDTSYTSSPSNNTTNSNSQYNNFGASSSSSSISYTPGGSVISAASSSISSTFQSLKQRKRKRLSKKMIRTAQLLVGNITFHFMFCLTVLLNIVMLGSIYKFYIQELILYRLLGNQDVTSLSSSSSSSWPSPWMIVSTLSIAYYIYICTLGAYEYTYNGNPWTAFSQDFVFFKIWRQFFQLSIHTPVPVELQHADDCEETAQFILAGFPHGCGSEYRVLMDSMLHIVFRKTHAQFRTLAASVLFRIPLIREVALWTHCVNANKQVAEDVLNQGLSLFILPGGEAEQIRTEFGKEKVYLSKRKGFIKLALKKGVPIVPMYVFGCSDYYNTSRLLWGPRLWLQKTLGICIPIQFGYYGSPLCPKPVKTTIVFGKPLSFPPIKNVEAPTQQEIDIAHEQFCQALTQLFDSHKNALGYGDRKLIIK